MQQNFMQYVYVVESPSSISLSAKRSLTQKTIEDPCISVGEGFETTLQHEMDKYI